MTYQTALRLSYVALAISLASLAVVMASFVFKFQIPSHIFRPLMGVSYLWPGAAFAIAWFKKKVEQGQG